MYIMRVLPFQNVVLKTNKVVSIQPKWRIETIYIIMLLYTYTAVVLGKIIIASILMISTWEKLSLRALFCPYL